MYAIRSYYGLFKSLPKIFIGFNDIIVFPELFVKFTQLFNKNIILIKTLVVWKTFQLG